jgi:hypothetical protein
MKLFFIYLILVFSNIGYSEEIEKNGLSACTEEFLIQDQLFIDKYGGNGKKSVRQTVELKR